MKKVLSLSLALLVLFSCFGAMAEKQEPFPETVEFSYLTQMWEPFSAENNLVSEYEKAMNVKMDVEWAPVDNYSTRVLTSLAGDLPDVIMLRNVSDVATLVDQGAVVPLTDLLNEYCPNLMRFISEEDLAYLYNVGDGEIYVIPAVTDIPNINTWTVRQDWLDNLGMEMPTDWEGWKNLLRAFRDQDANGNGDPKDEIPYAGELWHFLYSYGIFASSTNNGISASTTDSLFCVDENGNYTLIFEHGKYRDYLTEMVEMYKEGLIDPEFATREETEKPQGDEQQFLRFGLYSGGAGAAFYGFPALRRRGKRHLGGHCSGSRPRRRTGAVCTQQIRFLYRSHHRR